MPNEISNAEAEALYAAVKEKLTKIESLSRSKPRERTERKILLREVSDELYSLYDFLLPDPKRCLEIVTLSNTLTQLLNDGKDNRWLQKQSTAFFTKKFKKESKKIKKINFLSKVAGVQQGNRMCIDYTDAKGNDHQIIYYIKTHQYGSLRAGGSSTTPVDFKELFIYRALEYSGFGPKAFFFFNPLSPTAFYIATQDETFTKQTHDKIKLFKTVSQAEDRFKEEIQKVSMTEITKQGVAKAEILRRILNLWDITSNTGNYGFTNIDQAREKWRVIDFRVTTAELEESYLSKNIFNEFRDGKSMENYVLLAESVLKHATPSERIKLCCAVTNELAHGKQRHNSSGRKMKLTNALEKAHLDIKELIELHKGNLPIKDLKLVLDDLDRYKKEVQSNLASFIEDAASLEHAEDTEAVSTAGPAGTSS